MSPPPATAPINEFHFSVSGLSHGIRIDRFLARQLRNYTRFRLQRMIRARVVRIDGRVVSDRHRMKRGEEVSIRLMEPPDKLFEAEPMPVDVLFEDDVLLAVNKPAGQIVHPVGRWQRATLCNALQWHLDQQTALRGILRPGIVHRLDRLTSGGLVVCKTFAAHRHLSLQFQRQQVVKQYIALVEGRLQPRCGAIELPIGRMPGGEGILMTTRPDARCRKPARTDYEVIRDFAETTLVRAKPLTGRIHQLRVHFAAKGHPVVGDEFYGPFGEIRNMPCAQKRVDSGESNSTYKTTGVRHLLHAAEIVFRHPVTGAEMIVHAPLPDDFPAISFPAVAGSAAAEFPPGDYRSSGLSSDASAAETQ